MLAIMITKKFVESKEAWMSIDVLKQVTSKRR